MSLIVFPFKQEDPGVIGANFDSAARHGLVDEVWGVAASEGASLDQAATVAGEVTAAHGTPVRVFPQDRLGIFRSGKGDGMNTAIRAAAERGFERVHFYDADITNFDERWIEGAEQAADRGYEIVRHRFPRASTDAMITWMITKPLLAMIFPGTVLPRLGQPLGGELLFEGRVTESLATDPFVIARSDWGIDTVLTHATSTLGAPLYENNVAEGKRHALYGSLDELRTMVVECLDAVRSLDGRPAPPPGAVFDADPPAPVPDDLKHTMAYDIEPTMRLLTSDWTDEEVGLCRSLPDDLRDEVLQNRSAPHFGFMDAETWGEALTSALSILRLGEPASESLVFRLWLMRVLAYTTGPALSGYDVAVEYLAETISLYEKQAGSANRGIAPRPTTDS